MIFIEKFFTPSTLVMSSGWTAHCTDHLILQLNPYRRTEGSAGELQEYHVTVSWLHLLRATDFA